MREWHPSERWFACENAECTWEASVKTTCDECGYPLEFETKLRAAARLAEVVGNLRVADEGGFALGLPLKAVYDTLEAYEVLTGNEVPR